MKFDPKTLAFLFPGQGSQKVGMGHSLFKEFKTAKETFLEADDALQFSLSQLCFEGPEEKLKLTEFTQPAILTHSIAAARVLKEETGFTPEVVLGHSLGEYSALVWAGSLRFQDAVRIVRLRGQFMQEAVPEGLGAMAAILRLSSDQVKTLCESVQASLPKGEIVSPANFNSPEQTVIAGTKKGVETAIEELKSNSNYKGGRATLLPVSAPFHCDLMTPAKERLSEALTQVELHSNQIAYIPNVKAKWFEPGTPKETIRTCLIDQVSGSVKWTQSIQTLSEKGITSCIEIGPGTVLSGLLKRINPTLPSELAAFSMGEAESLPPFQEPLL